MKQIDNYIVEKLHLNKKSKYTEDTPLSSLFILADSDDNFNRLQEEIGEEYLIDYNLPYTWSANTENENGFLLYRGKAKQIADKTGLRAYSIPPKYKRLIDFAYDWVRGETDEDHISQYYVNLKEL